MPKMLGVMVGMDWKNSARSIEIPQVQYLDKVDGYGPRWWLGGLRLRVSQKISFCTEGSFPYTSTAWTLSAMVVGWTNVLREVTLTPQQT